MDKTTVGTPDSNLYTPLDPFKHEIRLLRITPSEEPDVFASCECTMIKESLLNPHLKYNAVSYVWGDPAVKEPILVNGHRVDVTKNLFSFLFLYRKFAKMAPEWVVVSMLFWVDALCINQNDVDERNSQVQMMASIYRGAANTVAWLGEGDGDIEHVFATIARVIPKIHESQEEGPMAWLDAGETDLWKLSQESTEGKSSYNRFWTGFINFMWHPYWHRAWIVQETILSEIVILFCGKSFTPLDAFRVFFASIQRLYGKPCPAFVDKPIWRLVSTAVGRSTMHARALRVQMTLQGWISSRDVDAMNESDLFAMWRDMVIQCRMILATDPRDKLYSLLGLLNGRIRPNYSAPVEDVYTEFARRCIQTEWRVSLLTHAGHWTSPNGLYDADRALNLFVPSWVPNWDRISKEPGFEWLLHSDDLADAGSESLARGRSPSFLEGDSLVARGILHDEISSARSCNSSDGSWTKFCIDYDASMQGRSYASGISPLQALACLLVQDRKSTSQSPIGPPSLDDHEGSLRDAVFVYLAFLRACAGLESNRLDGGQSDKDQTAELKEHNIHGGWGTGISAQWLEKLVDHEQFQQPEYLIAHAALSGERGVAKLLQSVNQLGVAAKLRMLSQLGSTAKALKLGESQLQNTAKGMQLHMAFTTSKGYIGWAHHGIQAGDLVCVLFGCRMPVILRNVGSHYIHMGPCYVLGLMNGAAVSNALDGSSEVRSFCIR